MNKILGIFGLLVFVCLFTTVLDHDFVSAYNMYNITRWSALFGILSIGVAFVIITGGIDLSIGSVVGLIGCLLPMFLVHYGWSVLTSIVFVMGISLAIGLLHGLLITKLELQPFVVTLCGLLFYRGLARRLTLDQTQGFGQAYNEGLRLVATGKPCSVATLLLITGGVLAVWFLLRGGWFWYRKDSRRVKASVVGFVLTALLAVIGYSQFWQGYDAQVGPVAVSIPEGDETTPGKIMFRAGRSIFVPTALAFVVLGLRDGFRHVWLSTLALIVAGAFFAAVVSWVAPNFELVRRGDAYLVNGMRLSGGLLRNLIMLVVFLASGLLMGSIGWLTSLVAAASSGAKRLLPVVLFGGVLWLTGMTALPETMVPMPALIMVATAIAAAIFLNQTIFGRYLLALGRNEEAARFSGINTDRMIILAYVICSGMAGLGAILFAADINSVQPSGHGNFYELYAIAAAVLGGCSLRGGEGSILGVVIGAAVMRVLYNAINILGIDTTLEFAIIGLVILGGAIVDVLVKRIVVLRRGRLQAREMT